MTKSQLARYQRRRVKILHMLRHLRLPQVAIAKKLKMTPQRVNQILAEEGIRPKDTGRKPPDSPAPSSPAA